jgi:hypothetical protein
MIKKTTRRRKMKNPRPEDSSLSSFLWMTLGIGITFVGLAMLAHDTAKEKLKDVIEAIGFDI